MVFAERRLFIFPDGARISHFIQGASIMDRKSLGVLIAGLIGAALMAHGQQVIVPLGYTVEYLQVSSSEAEASALSIDPNDENVLYATIGGWSPQKVVRIDLGQNPPAVSDFANGAYNIAGADTEDNALDSRFTTIGGLAVLQTGELVVVDNNARSEIPGDTIYIARDLNNDGDAMDIIDDNGTTIAEVVELIAPIEMPPGSGWGGFSGQQAEVTDDGSLYIVTSDGFGEGEVLRIGGAPLSPSISVWCSGLDYGAGLGFDSAGDLFVGSSSWPSGAALYRTRDVSEPPDNDALDVGEMIEVSNSITGIYDLTFSAEDDMFITNGRYIEKVDQISGEAVVFATFPEWTFLGDIVITTRSKPFTPTGGAEQARMIVADGNGDGMLTVIVPAPSTTVEPSRWARYE